MKHGHTDITAAAATVADFRVAARPVTGLLLLSLGFALVAMAAAHVRLYLPFTPVPVTMQTFVVLLAGLCLGATWGGLSQAKYLALGAVGLPAFAGGLAALAGPSGGYLVGFVLAAVVVGRIYSAWRSTIGATVACLAGTAVIYLFGCIWLAAITGGTLSQVLAIGAVPFIPGDLLKMAMALLLVRGPLIGAWTARFFGHN